MSEQTAADSSASTNGRVYLDGVVSGTRAAASPKRRGGITKLLVPAIAAGALLLVLRRLKVAAD
jgi:hypothetical protein